jgi:leader peptidase (prepilin peptidase) / N-methyltransferase
VIPFLLALLGLILGSFIATLVLRWPEGRSVGGRSACDGCGRTLGARDLVPLLSAVASRGRCRTCGGRIDPVHWQVELAAALVGLAAGLVAPGPEALAGAAFGWLLLALAALDLRALWLPDRLTAVLAAGGVVTSPWFAPALEERLVGGAAGFALLWLVSAGYRRVRGREGMGGGDPKLFGAIGLWLGWRMLPPVLLAASLLGLGVALVAAVRGRPLAGDHPLPLGTLLAAAAYPAWLLMVGSGA